MYMYKIDFQQQKRKYTKNKTYFGVKYTENG